MTTFTIENTQFSVPTSADELTIDQLFFLAYLQDKQLTLEEARLKCFLKFSGIKVQHNKEKTILYFKKNEWQVSPEQVVQLASTINWLFSEPDENNKATIMPYSCIQKLPVCQAGCVSLYGPADALSDISFEQFIMLQTYASVNDIERMICCIYHQYGQSVDLDNLPQLLLVKKLSPSTKTIISWYYSGCLLFLKKKFPHVFSGGGSSSGNVFENQMQLIDSLADGDATRKPQLRALPLYDVLYTLENLIIKSENQKKANKSLS